MGWVAPGLGLVCSAWRRGWEVGAGCCPNLFSKRMRAAQAQALGGPRVSLERAVSGLCDRFVRRAVCIVAPGQPESRPWPRPAPVAPRPPTSLHPPFAAFFTRENQSTPCAPTNKHPPPPCILRPEPTRSSPSTGLGKVDQLPKRPQNRTLAQLHPNLDLKPEPTQRWGSVSGQAASINSSPRKSSILFLYIP